MITVLKVIAVNAGERTSYYPTPRGWGVSNRGDGTGVL